MLRRTKRPDRTWFTELTEATDRRDLPTIRRMLTDYIPTRRLTEAESKVIHRARILMYTRPND